MRFTVVGHATLFVEGDRTLLVDPWLFGSCYWRSW
jgi:UDP-MurNAc hydroxylase